MHSLDAQQQCGELDMADSISTMAEMTLKVEATSPLQCAFSCLQLPGCKCLCFSVTTSECHVGDEMTSVSLALTTFVTNIHTWGTGGHAALVVNISLVINME